MMQRFACMALLFFGLASAGFSASASRTMPASYTPGQSITVSLAFTPDSTTAAWGAVETPPSGWTATNITGNGTASGGSIRWIVLPGGTANQPQTFTYTATPPASDTGNKTFSGVADFGSGEQSIGGSTSITGPGGGTTSGPAVRSFSPGNYTAGQAVTVSIAVTPPSGTQAWGAVETPPSGWAISGINEGGSASGGAARWIVLPGATANQPKTLTYQATPPSGESGTRTFSGVADFGSGEQNVAGATTLSDAASSGCGSPTTLCLGVGDRFKVTGTWSTVQDPTLKPIMVSTLRKLDSANLHFGNPENLEVLIKVLPACAINQNYWVFLAATTDVNFDIVVTDTKGGQQKTYQNRAVNGQAKPATTVTDTAAFATCP
jgi:hypothetical protein